MGDRVTHKRVESYLKECLRWFGLAHIQYSLRTLSGERVDEQKQLVATVQTTNRGMDADFEIAIGRPWPAVKRSVIHECLHVATWELLQCAMGLSDVLRSDGYEILCQQALNADERLVVRLERAIMAAIDTEQKEGE